MKRIPAGLFKAQCLRLMDEVRERREAVLITKRGVPVAKLVPAEEGPESVFGCMEGTAEIVGDLLESPFAGEALGATERKWDRLHR